MKCLIIDEMHPSIIPGLEKLGFDVHNRPDIKRSEVLEIIHDYQGLIVRSKTNIDHEFLLDAENLQFVARAGAGVDNVDADELESKGIILINTPEGNRDALAEHVVGLILSLLQNIVKGDTEVKSGIWNREGNRGSELRSKTIGLIGYGYMGSAVATRLKSFGRLLFFLLEYTFYPNGKHLFPRFARSTNCLARILGKRGYSYPQRSVCPL